MPDLQQSSSAEFEHATEFKLPLWLNFCSWISLVTLVIVPLIIIIGLFSGMDSIKVELFGIKLDGPAAGAISKIVLSSIFLFAGYVGFLIKSRARQAFRVGLYYCYYAFTLSAVFHVINVGTKNLDCGATLFQYSLLLLFTIYLHIKRPQWESSQALPSQNMGI